MEFLNELGQNVRLGTPITSPGGEGTIYDVPSDPTVVAKVYHTPPSEQKATKLQHQNLVGKPELHAIAAWPRSLLYDHGRTRATRGFLMPRMSGKEIHRLYGPRDRQSEFPSVAWDFLIKVARNCAAAFETLHENDIVMADVNEKNLLVKNNGTVGLIDCDSYQIKNGHGYFLCGVGVPLWTPPELQGQDYTNLVRTPNHDRFGLAVLIFELLFMGRHPYAGVPVGGQQYELEEGIRRFLFAFSPKVWGKGVKSPPYTLTLTAIPERLALLFERAFLPGSEKPNARPSGREWANELEVLYNARKLCSYDPGHKFWNGLTSCPWCQIAATGGPNFFITVSITNGGSSVAVDATAFWHTIQRIIKGTLMREKVTRPLLPTLGGNPMPMPKPQSSRLSAPQEPSRPAPLPTPSLMQPELPPKPKMAAPARLPKVPMERTERLGRISMLGTVFFAIATCFVATLNMMPAMLGVGWGVLVCLVLTVINFPAMRVARGKRKTADQEARSQERWEANQAYKTQMTQWETLVDSIQKAHSALVARAEAGYQRECKRLEMEYQLRFDTYSAQYKLYEDERIRFEKAKAQWDEERNRRGKKVDQTKRELDDTLDRLNSLLRDYQGKVQAQLPTLEAAYRRFEKAKSDETSDMQRLQAKKREAQLRQFLDTKLLKNYKLPGIGQQKMAALLAYGCESALDIEPSIARNVAGIGESLLTTLMAWRNKCEREFRYDPNIPLPAADVRSVKIKHAQSLQNAFFEVRGGAATLSAMEADTSQKVRCLQLKIPDLANAHAQAIADYSIGA